MDDCLFCGIVGGEVPGTRVYEDDRAIAILDIFPATRGHVLVVPRDHAGDVRDIADDDLAHCAVVAKRLAQTATERLGADGVTIMQSNGPAAWQTIFHYHVHVIPRYDGDPLVLPWKPGESPQDDLSDVARLYSGE
jgi:histidine triad (HIT) family protein